MGPPLADTLDSGVALPNVRVPVARRLDFFLSEELRVGGQDVGNAGPQTMASELAAARGKIFVGEPENLAYDMHPEQPARKQLEDIVVGFDVTLLLLDLNEMIQIPDRTIGLVLLVAVQVLDNPHSPLFLLGQGNEDGDVTL